MRAKYSCELITHCCFLSFRLDAGIQTQMHRSLGAVLLKKSAAGEAVAEANEREGEGQFYTDKRYHFNLIDSVCDEIHTVDSKTQLIDAQQ